MAWTGCRDGDEETSYIASTRFVETILGTTGSFDLFEGPGTGLRGRLGARLTWCDRVRPHYSAPLIVCSKDRHRVARKAWSWIDLVRPCREPHYSAPLIVCSKDRHWVPRKAWSLIDLVRPCRAGHTTCPLIVCSKALGCEDGLEPD
jgi:hypothetical protein